MQETALEWFLKEFQKQVWFEKESELDIWINKLIPKAKEKEKQQIIECIDLGVSIKKEMVAMAMEKFSEDFEKLRIYMNNKKATD
jgi:hypothetical protein